MTDIAAAFRNIQGSGFSALMDFRREWLVVAAVVVLSILSYRFAYLKNIERAKAADARLAAGKAEVARIKEQIRAGERLRDAVYAAGVSLERTEMDLRAVKERLPSDRHISAILADISVNGPAARGLRILSIKPVQVEEKGSLLRIPLHVSAEGGFVQTGRYIERIENLQRIITVDNLLIESKDGGPGLSSQIYLSAYILGHGQ